MSRLVNIYNNYRTIYLFKRDEEGHQFIDTVADFYPYFYESSDEQLNNKKSVTGIPVKKIIVSNPLEVPKRRSDQAWEADVLFVKRFMLDKIKKLEKCPIKWAMLDIEVLAKELPDVTQAKDPISCITIYNNFTKLYNTFYLGDYETEYQMMEDFITYLQKEKFDLLIGWNMTNFDYPYLANRHPDFAQQISPINETRYGQNCQYPAGISIVDYYSWFKKITAGREKSYKLDNIAQKYLKDEPKGEVDFSKLSIELKEKNKLDVNQLVRLEEKRQLIPYYDEIRRLSKVEWEDMIWNSRIIDQLLLQEASRQNLVLPMKPSEERGTLNEKEEFEGAYREVFKTGVFKNVGKYDLASAYPYAIMDFCLDPANIKLQQEKNCIKIEEIYFKQNEEAILPIVVKKLTTLKNQIKEKLITLKSESSEYKNIKQMYDAVKAIVNSAYGVMGNRFFRLYDKRVASATTFIVRSLLYYVRDKLKELDYEVIYIDTDSVFVQSKENITDLLNKLIQEWAKEIFGKENVNIEFGYEGLFEKLFILTLCRYDGDLRKPDGDLEREIKGIEAKRKDSTIFQKTFQKELLKQLKEEKSKEDIISWIQQQFEVIKTAPLEEIGFPCKLAQAKENYKNIPIFVRALENTENFDRLIGEDFYYIYVLPTGYERRKERIEFLDGKKLTLSSLKKEWQKHFGENIPTTNINKQIDKKEELLNFLEANGRLIVKEGIIEGKPKDVMAFDRQNKKHITNLDWDRIIDRNIMMKLDSIFEAMKWDIKEINYKPLNIKCSLKREHSRNINIEPINKNQTQLF